MPDYPDWFVQHIKNLPNKRARMVAVHILEHGFITTETIRDQYGYEHAPRAARDLRELGIPLQTRRVKNADGKTIAEYHLGDVARVRIHLLSGRMANTRQIKSALIAENGTRCALCHATFSEEHLQIDHRVPYEIGGELGTDSIEAFQLVCRTCNRAKSWSCEQCPNWQRDKDPTACMACFWGNADTHTHVALTPIRRLELVWSEDQITQYELLRQQSSAAGLSLPDFVRAVLRQFLGLE